jgi:TetR/AcrR family transcriptional regulator
MSPARKPKKIVKKPGRPVGEAPGAGRAALLKAARELLAEQGLSQLTSKAVGERAGLKPTLVNYYFGNRDGLLRAVVSETSDEVTQRIIELSANEGSVEERLRKIMEAILRGYADDPCAARLFFEHVVFAGDEALDSFSEQSGRSAIGALRRVLEDGSREGRFQHIDPEIAVAAIGGICIMFGAATPLLQRVLDMEPLTNDNVESIARRASDLILGGLLVRGA